MYLIDCLVSFLPAQDYIMHSDISSRLQISACNL